MDKPHGEYALADYGDYGEPRKKRHDEAVTQFIPHVKPDLDHTDVDEEEEEKEHDTGTGCHIGRGKEHGHTDDDQPGEHQCNPGSIPASRNS